MRIDTLQYVTGMPRSRAEQLLTDEPECLDATTDQARLESAIFDRIGLLARGHTPGTVETAIHWVEPRQRSIVIQTGEGFDHARLAVAITPEIESGVFSDGIPALRSGPSSRGVVLYRDGIDAAVILARTSYRVWTEAVAALQRPSDGSAFVTHGRATDEEAAAVVAEAQRAAGHGSLLLRTVGALQALPHVSIDVYGKSPGTVVEVVQPEAGYPARDRLRDALERAGLQFVADRSPMGEDATFVFRVPNEDERPLLIRLVARPMKFPRWN